MGSFVTESFFVLDGFGNRKDRTHICGSAIRETNINYVSNLYFFFNLSLFLFLFAISFK